MTVRLDHTNLRRTAAFTLTELLLVLLLIGIFSGVMLTDMRGTFQDALLRSSARDLMGGLSLASSRAVTLNRTYAFTVEHSSNTFRVQPKQLPRESANGAKNEEPAEVHRVDERITLQLRDPSASAEEENEEPDPAESEMEPNVILFYPDGTADGREILLTDQSHSELLIRVNPVTARVRVIEGDL